VNARPSTFSVVDEARLAQVLDAAEAAVLRGEPLASTGFWQAVAALKRDRELRDRYARRVADIDTAAFRRWAFLPIPTAVGVTLAVLATAAGIVLVGVAYGLDEPGNWITFLAGTAILLGSTHTLAHVVVGRLLGIRFSHWFVASKTRPVPGGAKIDYASYLAASPRRRAWMHASGALVTKAIPFLLVGAAVAADLPVWVVWALIALGVLLIVNDIALSTRASDWKRFRREMAFAREEE
jgi:hypothetical protein